MIITVVVMRVMEMPRRQVVDMVAVGHSLMPAPRTMLVTRLMRSAEVRGRAIAWICCAYFQGMLIHMVPVHAVQMAVMKVIGVACMLNRGMAAALSVNMGVALVNGALWSHSRLLSNSLR